MPSVLAFSKKVWTKSVLVLFLSHEITNTIKMKKTTIISAAVALALCSCGTGNNQPQEQNQGKLEQPVTEVVEEANSFVFDDLVSNEEDDFFALGDLNNDGIKDLAIIAKNEVYRNQNEGIEPVQGDGLRIYFGDADGRYTLFKKYSVNTHPDEFYANWSNLAIGDDGLLFIQEGYATDGEVVQNYYLKYLNDDLYLNSYSSTFGVDDDNVINYDLVNKKLVVDVDWHEMDTDINHHRTDTYELKDVPMKKLSDFKIGDEVCSFEEYVEDDGLNVFAHSGNTKEELCSAEYDPTYEEGDLNNDGVLDLVVNALNSTFAVYYKDPMSGYHMEFQGKSFDKYTETYAYIEEGNLIVNSTTESGKTYTFRDNGYGYYRLLEFEQSMVWPDGGGSYYQRIDFVNGTRLEQEDDKPATTVNIPKRAIVIEEIHFGNMDEIEQFIME